MAVAISCSSGDVFSQSSVNSLILLISLSTKESDLEELKNILNCVKSRDNMGKEILAYGRLYMAVSYDKLWKLLIDKKMNKTQLCEKAKISTNAMAKLGKNEDVHVEVLARICLELGCSMDGIMEILPEKE